LKHLLLWKKDQNTKGVIAMLFKTKFKVVEIRDNGVTITHYLEGNKRDVKNDVEMAKLKAKNYEMVGKNGMVVWM
jgi:hypothetical protein